MRSTEEFRLRRRFALRLDAKFSATLRRHGHCAADPWTTEDSGVADALLKGLRAIASRQRARVGARVHDDEDAYIWPDEVHAIGALVRQA